MNTHQKYRTINHHHFDFTYRRGDTFDYTMSGLALVQCEDGRWFVEQEFGDEYSQFAGVVKSGEDVETGPVFYPNVDAAAKAAFALIKQIYPTTDDQRLQDFLKH